MSPLKQLIHSLRPQPTAEQWEYAWITIDAKHRARVAGLIKEAGRRQARRRVSQRVVAVCASVLVFGILFMLVVP